MYVQSKSRRSFSGGGKIVAPSYLLPNAPAETSHASICVKFVRLSNPLEVGINRSIGSD